MTLPGSEIDLRERKCYYDETGMEIGEGTCFRYTISGITSENRRYICTM